MNRPLRGADVVGLNDRASTFVTSSEVEPEITGESSWDSPHSGSLPKSLAVLGDPTGPYRCQVELPGLCKTPLRSSPGFHTRRRLL